MTRSDDKYLLGIIAVIVFFAYARQGNRHTRIPVNEGLARNWHPVNW